MGQGEGGSLVVWVSLSGQQRACWACMATFWVTMSQQSNLSVTLPPEPPRECNLSLPPRHQAQEGAVGTPRECNRLVTQTPSPRGSQWTGRRQAPGGRGAGFVG